MNNVIYMFRCVDSTLVVKGKVNSIVMDSCKKSAVVFDSLVSSVEFVNCQSVQMQVKLINLSNLFVQNASLFFCDVTLIAFHL